ncbi:TonB-dependent receptor domain-containing protein [Pseudohongiella spirulinae]|uniref:TonB-dependent receptor, plug n=1 Tax=Pseudohongiella spirulinae TaxID=1249552 RepID=A0A0S2KDI7_9GAMM|nr:TonB-dependent receptor [Pseudohongiella spirulinae]ALO46380.1 TonB-dependent receptor, plug [Pseudohongiella spirulinae]
MKRIIFRSITTASSLTAMLASSMAMAQTPAPEAMTDVEEIITVGSRVQGLSEDALPVTVMGADQIEALGATNMQDLLSHIPSIGDFEFQDSNTGTNGARGDVAGVNLRSLGTGNTLTLLNGRRMVVHPTFESKNGVPSILYNVNSIPSSAVSRIEVLRDGASALYGADATGGVVNMALTEQYEGFSASVKYGGSENTSYDETTLTAKGGVSINGGRTHLGFFATHYDRTGVMISELDTLYSNLDRRGNPSIPEEWRDDSQLNNLSSVTPYSVFQLGSLNSQGRFVSTGSRHVNQALQIGTGVGSQRFNFNEEVQITPDTERSNLMLTLSHDLDNGINSFSELTYYSSDSKTQRASGPLDSGLAYIIVPSTNYYNPTGSDVLLTRYRPTEMGARVIKVEQDSYRVLTGLSGEFNGWDWESAIWYSAASADDEEFNRMSKTLLSQSLAKTTPDSFNIFGGPGANSEDILNTVRISSIQKSESTLASWDAKFTKSDLFSLPAGDVGTALGLEWRRETYLDDRDPRQDGSMPYDVNGIFDESDVVGVSATRDSSASRTVVSAYAEFVVPLTSDLELQLAGRYEDFSDAGDTFKPKISAYYSPLDMLSLRASYSKGFRAPNLPQMNQGDIIRRILNVEDPLRADVTGLDIDTGALYRTTSRLGNNDLKPEHTDTVSMGFVFQPAGALDGLMVTFDAWEIEQRNVVVLLGEGYELDVEAQFGSNPNVVRAAPTAQDIALFDAWNAANPDDQRTPVGPTTNIISQYINADVRKVEGWDASVQYSFDAGQVGQFRLRTDVSKLSRFEQQAGPVTTDFVRRAGNPEWRASGSIAWMKNNWRSNLSARYVGSVYSTGLYNTIASGVSGTVDSNLNRVYWDVDTWTTFDWSVGYEFVGRDDMLNGTNISAGIRNLSDEEPPFADVGNGFYQALHNSYGRVWWLGVEKQF